MMISDSVRKAKVFCCRRNFDMGRGMPQDPNGVRSRSRWLSAFPSTLPPSSPFCNRSDLQERIYLASSQSKHDQQLLHSMTLPSTMDNPPGVWRATHSVPQISDEDSGASADDEASMFVSSEEEPIQKKPIANEKGKEKNSKTTIERGAKSGHKVLPAEILEV